MMKMVRQYRGKSLTEDWEFFWRGLRVDMFRIIPLFFICLITTSCSVSHERAMDSLKQSTTHYISVEEFKYEPIPDKGIDFALDESSDSFIFQSGKSYYKAFILPTRNDSYYIIVRSYCLGDHIKMGHIFYPHLILLDEKFAEIAQSDFVGSWKKVAFGEGPSVQWGGPRIMLEGSLFVDCLQARYLIVFTTDRLLDSTTPREILDILYLPLYFPPYYMNIPIPTGYVTLQIKHSAFGVLHVEIADKPLPVKE